MVVLALVELVGGFFAWLGGRLRRDMDNDEWERGTRSPLDRLTDR